MMRIKKYRRLGLKYRLILCLDHLLLPRRWVHNDKIGIDKLRRRLRLTERLIKRITNKNEYRKLEYLSESKWDMLEYLMMDREYLINQMFLLGCSDAEVDGFKRVNDNLHSLHLQMYERARELWRRELSYDIKEEFDDDIELDGEIFFTYNSEEHSLVKYDNDAWYGSDFAYMIELKYEIMDEGWHELTRCGTTRRLDSNPEMTDKQLGLDLILVDDTSWDDGCVWFCKNPKIKDIFINYPMHDIVTHKNIPLPDVVRMNDFWCEVRVRHQKIIDQNGRHESVIKRISNV